MRYGKDAALGHERYSEQILVGVSVYVQLTDIPCKQKTDLLLWCGAN